ncbi:hypothetical protein SLEP1_g4879 [Rubroshorea leprosula]|uniref:Transposase (putative) gypsy type domain-containing protein n=1 Tax=Rubroshorea leprosula TaxID=152421 RepID=A0AAV5HQ56_9ROSI|nr:hypothetical protein SLEP1_g4879 [Rubroshorea leprosula]
MVSLRELTEQRGNQGKEGEEGGVLSVEPITMIVPPELQDVPETMASESNTSSSASDNGVEHPSAPSSSSSEGTPGREEGVGDVVSHVSDRPMMEEWESRTITGRLSNLRKAPKDLPAGFRFRAVLHHEVANCTPSISGYRRLEDMVRAYHIPRTILLRTGAPNERACTVSQTGWIPVYADHFDTGLRFPLPRLVFDLLAEYELALTQLTPNSIRFIIGFMLLCERLEVPAKAIVFRSLFQCRLCPNSRGAKWYYLSGRDKSQLFKNVRNKVARWKRQFIFVRDTRAERISNDLAARLSEWRTPNAHINYPQLLPRDVDLKNQLLEYARGEGLIDLEALVTSEALVVLRFVDVTNLFSEGIFLSYSFNCSRAEAYAFFCAGDMSSILERQRQRAQGSRGRASGSTQPRQTRFDERPPLAPQSRGPSHRGSSSSSRPQADNRPEAAAPSARRRAREETESEEDEVPLARRVRSGGTQPTQALAQQRCVRPTHRQRLCGQQWSPPLHLPRWASGLLILRASLMCGQNCSLPWCKPCTVLCPLLTISGPKPLCSSMAAFNYAVALYESEQAARTENTELGAKCKELAIEKASLVDDVNRLQGSEMANRAAAAESRADELVSKNNELREELDRARAEKESGIQAAKEETVRVEERAKKAEADRDRTQHELASLRNQVAEAARNLNAAEEALNELKVTHGRSVAMARAQGAEWLVGSAAFQDAVAVASANVTTEIYNEIRGKVLHHRPDFPIRELVFFDEEKLDEQGKSLAPLADTTVRLRWDLNEEGVPVWPPSVLEDGEDPTGLASFDAWVEGAPVAEQKPLSTPPNSQLAAVPSSSPVNAPASEAAARSPPARSPAAATDASMPVDLTDD